MEWQYTTSIAGTVLFGVLVFAIKEPPPQWIVWPLIAAAVLFGCSGIPWVVHHVPLGAILAVILGFSLLLGGGIATYQSWPSTNGKTDQTVNIALLWRTDFNVGSYKMLQDFSTALYKTDGDRLGFFDFGVGIYGSFDSQSVFMSFYAP
jgi:hypothetical protein